MPEMFTIQTLYRLHSTQGGNKQPMILNNPNPKLVGGFGDINFGKQYRKGNRVYDSNSVAMCFTDQLLGDAGGNSYLYAVPESSEKQEERPSMRIRKLTPRKCWRLMGFYDEDFDKVEKVNSNTQLYKQAGNSIVVDVLVAIFDNLLVHSRSVWLDELLSDSEETTCRIKPDKETNISTNAGGTNELNEIIEKMSNEGE